MDIKDVENLAKLARIDLSKEEKENVLIIFPDFLCQIFPWLLILSSKQREMPFFQTMILPRLLYLSGNPSAAFP